MKDLQLHATHLSHNEWLVELYNPNIGVVEQELGKKFTTIGEAKVWAEALGNIEKVYDGGETIWVKIPYGEKENAEKLLAL